MRWLIPSQILSSQPVKWEACCEGTVALSHVEGCREMMPEVGDVAIRV